MSDHIKCPVCNKEMAGAKCHNVEVDKCPQCRGIWFDALEAKALREVAGSAKQVDSCASNAPKEGSRKPIDCPRCHGRMSPTHDREQPHIVFEKCSSCSGVFFDAGEFADLQEVTLAEKLRDWVL